MKLTMRYTKDYATALILAWDVALRTMLINGTVENDCRLMQAEFRDFIRMYNGH